MHDKKDPYKGKRIPFCRWYLALGNPAEAAVRAGCPPDTAEQDGLALLHSAYCRSYLRKLAAAPALRQSECKDLPDGGAHRSRTQN